MMKKTPHIIWLLGFLAVGIGISACDLSEEGPLDGVERAVKLEEVLYFFQQDRDERYNAFEQEEGLFRFDHLNHLEVKESRGIYFLQDIRDGTVAFQIFEKEAKLDFNEGFYQCETYEGKDPIYKDKTMCFTVRSPNDEVINLELFAEPDLIFEDNYSFLAAQSAMDLEATGDRFDFFTRAQMLELALSMRYPEMDFSQFAANCFGDVTQDHPLSGYVCYAQEEGIVEGIAGNFYPESSINKYGLLKILFLVFEEDDRAYDETALDPRWFEKMNVNHYAYPLMSKALYEGLISNPRDDLVWSNEHAYKGEVMEVTRGFLEWQEGKIFKNYEADIVSLPVDNIWLQEDRPFYRFEEEGNSDIDAPRPLQGIEIREGWVYVPDRGNVLLKAMPVPGKGELISLTGVQNYARQQIGLTFEYADREEVYYETHPEINQFEFLKTNFSQKALSLTLQKLERMQLLPETLKRPKNEVMPHLEVFMDEPDFLNLFEHRTSDQRYPAHLVLTYPNGEQVERSIYLKTRGNATRGYIKSSYTIEAFENFEDVAGFEGDEFLAEHDEMKLRSFINEKTLIHEKLFYRAFAALGHPAPAFFEATVEVNGVQMGVYQITEPIKKDFFRRRDMATDHYYYAQNVPSEYPTNLQYHRDDETTLSQYELKGEAELLLDFIERLDANDPSLKAEIDVQNVFDYALLTYLADAHDSLTHNFYVHWEEESQLWTIFPWDADASFIRVFPYEEEAFRAYVAKDEDWFNNLIRYVFAQISEEEFDQYVEDFEKRWRSEVDLVAWTQDYKDRYHELFDFDNALWNDHHIERKTTFFETNKAIDSLVESLKVIEEPF